MVRDGLTGSNSVTSIPKSFCTPARSQNDSDGGLVVPSPATTRLSTLQIDSDGNIVRLHDRKDKLSASDDMIRVSLIRKVAGRPGFFIESNLKILRGEITIKDAKALLGSDLYNLWARSTHAVERVDGSITWDTYEEAVNAEVDLMNHLMSVHSYKDLI